jgi:hypothetical protein
MLALICEALVSWHLYILYPFYWLVRRSMSILKCGPIVQFDLLFFLQGCVLNVILFLRGYHFNSQFLVLDFRYGIFNQNFNLIYYV